MKYIATVLLALMTITLVTCGILLWKRRKEPNDNSRTIQAVFSWISAFFTLTFLAHGQKLPLLMELSLNRSTHLFPFSYRCAFSFILWRLYDQALVAQKFMRFCFHPYCYWYL